MDALVYDFVGAFMVRKSLYLAVAAVLLSAAQAQAARLGGYDRFDSVTSADASGAIKLAQELTYYASATSSATATQADVAFFMIADAGFSVGESLLLTLDLEGAIFKDANVLIATGSGTSCTVDNVVSVTPAVANATSAQYLVQLGGDCSANDNFYVRVGVQSTGQDMVIGARLQQSFGGQRINIDGGRATATFVDVTPGFSAVVEPLNSGAIAMVGEAYRMLNHEPAIGRVTVSADGDVSKSLATNTPASSSDIDSINLTATALTGSFSGINLSAGDLFEAATASASVSTVRVLAVPGQTGAIDVSLVDNTATATTAGINADGVIQASTFNLKADVNLVAGLADFSAVGDMSPVYRDGVSFVAPWVALGSASANSTIRLANSGSTDTGPIQMTLTSSNVLGATTETVTIGAAQLVSGSLTASGGIPAGGVVAISGAALKTAFGSEAANGDLEINIEAQQQFMTGKVRVTQSTGQIFETSLGNLQGDD
jgi:hypothetical protein